MPRVRTVYIPIPWTPEQIKHFRRVVLRESCQDFADHFIFEDGRLLSARTIHAWDQGVRRPSLCMRLQLSQAWASLLRKYPALRLP
jgi:hypothetical protein